MKILKNQHTLNKCDDITLIELRSERLYFKTSHNLLMTSKEKFKFKYL